MGQVQKRRLLIDSFSHNEIHHIFFSIKRNRPANNRFIFKAINKNALEIIG